MAQRVKRLPAMRETCVRSLGWEDPLEKEMATHSSILTWRIPWTEEPGRLQFMGSQRVRHDWATSLSLSSHILMQPVIYLIFPQTWKCVYIILVFQTKKNQLRELGYLYKFPQLKIRIERCCTQCHSRNSGAHSLASASASRSWGSD